MQQLEDSLKDAAQWWCTNAACRRGQSSTSCPQCDRSLDADGFCGTHRRFHDPATCYKCGLPTEQRDLAHFVAIPPDRRDEDIPQPRLVCAPLTAWANRIYHEWDSLGRDEGGRPLRTEQHSALDELGVTDRAERAIILRLWQIRTNASLVWRLRRLEAERAAAEARRN